METTEKINLDEIRFQIGVLMRDGYHCAANMLKKLAIDAVNTFHEYKHLDKAQESAELLEKMQQLERERDAAVNDLKTISVRTFSACIACKHSRGNGKNCPRCAETVRCFEWRGTCKENGGIEA